MRVAFFPDSFLEINGVAMTSRRFVEYAKRKNYPVFCVYAGEKTEEKSEESIIYLSLKRSVFSVPMDEGLKYDPLFQRHRKYVLKRLIQFQPEIIHITGLNDVSILGAFLAWQMNLPLIGSWHTNLHEYAARRFAKICCFLPVPILNSMSRFIEEKILQGAILYYKMSRMILAPNQELLDILTAGTGRPGQLMLRGVDTSLYSPQKRSVKDEIFRFGFVGRLRPEKNLRLLAKVEQRLFEKGKTGFKFIIVGEGSEREWLAQNMKTAEFTGFLEGEALAETFANLDVLLFPSETDTFGNVVQEANASGVPAVVTNKGGPKFLVHHAETGLIAQNEEEFINFAVELMENPEMLSRMKQKAFQLASSRSWDSVFQSVYEAYEKAVKI
ncbi:MAG: glycosyltransferase [Pyrinomonadaceae bacterium]|nr:glycosyltransferase [Pyrinomonadaceae bacterium]MCX7640180.1 glycosyltransferase [Pyrinomonadaceae bacterium]MDW8303232.1 glycosyltransferase [Acidobacteriota bacterium]